MNKSHLQLSLDLWPDVDDTLHQSITSSTSIIQDIVRLPLVARADELASSLSDLSLSVTSCKLSFSDFCVSDNSFNLSFSLCIASTLAFLSASDTLSTIYVRKNGRMVELFVLLLIFLHSASYSFYDR